MAVPHELAVEEIQQVVRDFADSARRALAAGFQVVEVHGAHGVDLLDVSTGGMVRDAKIVAGPNYQVPFATQARQATGMPTAAVGIITEPQQAEDIITNGQADAVFLGRELLRNPTGHSMPPSRSTPIRSGRTSTPTPSSAANADTPPMQPDPRINQPGASAPQPQIERQNMSKPTYVADHIAITEVLEKYNQGVANADSAIMKPAFAEEATIFGVEDGKLFGGAITGLYQGIDTDFRPSPDGRAVIAYINATGTAANARVDTNDVSGLCFTDYFNLLKVDGTWIIVSKIYHTNDVSKP